jgi:hypothetical protein
MYGCDDRDMVKSVIGDQKFVIEQLEHFIHGDR